MTGIGAVVVVAAPEKRSESVSHIKKHLKPPPLLNEAPAGSPYTKKGAFSESLFS